MIVFDIETIPNKPTLSFPEWAQYKARKNISEDRDASLHPAFGMVCCICALHRESGEVFAEAIPKDSIADEKKMLQSFRSWLHQSRDPWLGGFNVKGFDIPFLANRFLSHRETVPSQLSVAGKKPWEIKVVDVMELLQFGGGPKISLGDACVLMGIPTPKEDFSGKMVWGVYKDQTPTREQLVQLTHYCQCDVRQTDQILGILEAAEASV